MKIIIPHCYLIYSTQYATRKVHESEEARTGWSAFIKSLYKIMMIVIEQINEEILRKKVNSRFVNIQSTN